MRSQQDTASLTLPLSGRGRPWPRGEFLPVLAGEKAALTCILVIAACLRAFYLDSGLWYDEVFTLTHYVRIPAQQIVTDFSSFNNHIFYSLQAKASIDLFGESAWSLRLPALVFGVASVWATWLLARPMVGRSAALVAAFLLAVSSQHVWFSQNARGYTELLFWATLGTALFLRAIRQPGWAVAIGYAGCVIAAVYTQLSAAVFFAALGLVHVGALGWPRQRANHCGLTDVRMFAAYGAALVGTFLLYAPMLTQVHGTTRGVGGGGAARPLAEWQNPLRALQEIIHSADAFGVLAPITLIVVAFLCFHGVRLVARREPLAVALYALHVPLTVVVVTALSLRLWPRYFFIDAAFVMVCIAASANAWAGRGASMLVNRWGVTSSMAQHVTLSVIVVVATIASVPPLTRHYAYPKQDFAGAVALVERQRGPGDIVTSVGRASEALRSYYAPSWPVLAGADQLHTWLGEKRRVWLVIAFPGVTARNAPEVQAILQDRFEVVATLPGTLGDGTVLVYRSRDG
ncbi:MAG: glycosyltransferase family 39 protein [Casimicrobiaceae bacterium]